MNEKGRQRQKEDNRVLSVILPVLAAILFCALSCSSPSDKQPFAKENVQEDSIPAVAEVQETEIRKTSLEQYLDSIGLQDIQELAPSVFVNLKYASPDNFTGKVLYKDLSRAYLHPVAMTKLLKAQQILERTHPDLRLLVYDAARPLSVQKEMYDAVKNTPYRAYVANPERISLHNYGMAVDISLCDKDTIPLDMGTEFDYFGAKAGINQEELLIQQGKLTRLQVDNRLLLRGIMKEAGFTPIRGEWWHFNACSLSEAGKIAEVLQ